MSRNWLFIVTGISLIAVIAACGRSEIPAETATTIGAPAVSISPALPDELSQTQKIDSPQGKPGATLMESGMALAEKNNCLGCHTLDKKLVGPAWQDVAKRYKGVPGIEHTLIIKVSTGSVGNWGDMPMPAMAPAVKEEDIRTLVKFVLSLDQ